MKGGDKWNVVTQGIKSVRQNRNIKQRRKTASMLQYQGKEVEIIFTAIIN